MTVREVGPTVYRMDWLGKSGIEPFLKNNCQGALQRGAFSPLMHNKRKCGLFVHFLFSANYFWLIDAFKIYALVMGIVQ